MGTGAPDHPNQQNEIHVDPPERGILTCRRAGTGRNLVRDERVWESVRLSKEAALTRWIVIPALLVLAALTPVLAEEAAPEKEKPHALGAWTKLVEGQWLETQWHATGAWEGGTAFEARMVAEWGPGKTNLRLRIFVPEKDGEYLRYDSVYFVHPETKKPTYLSTAFDGETACGEFTIDGDTVTFVFPAKGETPSIRSAYRFTEKDRCRWTVEQKKGEEWSGMLDVNYARGKVAAKKLLATQPPDRKDLEPLARLIGKFDVVGKLPGGAARRVFVRSDWGLGRVIVTDYWLMDAKPPKLKERGFLWYDREKQAFREFRFPSGDAIAEGTYTVDGDVVVRESTIWSWPGDNVGRFRKTIRIENADRHSWDEVMKLRSGRELKMEHDMMATRRKENEAK